MALVDDFREAITAHASGKNLKVRLWQGVAQPSPHFLEISAPEPIVIWVATNRENGYWSLAKSQVDRLDEDNVEWAAVFLMGDTDKGWVLTGNELRRQIQEKKFLLTQNEAYKIFDKDLPENLKFHGFDALLRYLQLNWKL